MIRVLVVDDDPMVCEFLSTILTSGGEVDVCAVAHDGAAAIAAVEEHRPDVVLMDLRMPTMDGISATTQIRCRPDPPTVVVMTTFDTDANVVSALDAGAAGFLLKTTPPDRLLTLVKAAAAGGSVLSPEATARLVEHHKRHDAPSSEALPGLSGREREILALIAEGRTNGEIARRLYLSEGTVKSYTSRLMTKLHCSNRTQLALLAARARR
jgi:DNA-binding NarL/FixJ family response regulator